MSINHTEPLKYWSQRVLPIVYEESLSFYELTGKTIQYLNDVIKQTNELTDFTELNIKDQNKKIKDMIDVTVPKNLSIILEGWLLDGKTSEMFTDVALGRKNVLLLGVKGDGVADETTYLQDCLNIARDKGRVHLFFPKGVYHIHDTLRVYKNTTLEFADGAVIKRMGKSTKMFMNGDEGDTDYAGLYNGDGNIRFIGPGFMDLCGGENRPNTGTTGFFPFAHAKNIEVNGLTIANGYGGHMIEVNSSQDVRIINNTFMNVIVPTMNEGSHETVQIDYATENSFPFFGAFDGTPCKDVTVENNTFINVMRGVGQHHTYMDGSGNQIFHENIKTNNNTFKDSQGTCIKPESFKNSEVIGNVIENCGDHAIAAYGCDTLRIAGNKVDGAVNNGVLLSQKEGNRYNDPAVKKTFRNKNVTIAGNQVKKASQAISNLESDHTIIEGNIITESLKEGVYSRNSDNVFIEGNQLYGISQNPASRHNAIFMNGGRNNHAKGNLIDNTGYELMYSYAINVSSSSEKHRVENNDIVSGAGSSGLINNAGKMTSIDGRVLITDNLLITEGDITLLDDISNYRALWVLTGAVHTGEYMSQMVLPFNGLSFRPGTDVVTCLTSKGYFTASIINGKKLHIDHTDNVFRGIMGVI